MHIHFNYFTIHGRITRVKYSKYYLLKTEEQKLKENVESIKVNYSIFYFMYNQFFSFYNYLSSSIGWRAVTVSWHESDDINGWPSMWSSNGKENDIENRLDTKDRTRT